MPAWIVFLVIAGPIAGVLAWLVLDEAFVRIESGQLGLVIKRGKATDRALTPGPHVVPMFRRLMVQVYPSLELSYRAGEAGPEPTADAREAAGPPLRASLGDRADVTVSYTVRFRLDPERLRTVHERFGPDGLWAAVRDRSAAVLRSELEATGVGVDDLFGPARRRLEERLTAALGAALERDGFELVLFALGDLDLGRNGDVIQATVRARHELEREQAESATRLARAQHDAELSPILVGPGAGAALRYREVDAWRDLAGTVAERHGIVPPAMRPQPAEQPRDDEDPA